MIISDLTQILKNNSYPGRGIILGRTPDNHKSLIIYFIMGRSENSRNRIFAHDGDGIRTEAYDISKLSDPSLIIYSPVKTLVGKTIVTNGDQTDTIYKFLAQGKSFEDALHTREFEPDAPNFTPRISGLLDQDGSYKLSILKSAGGNPSCCQRFFFEYPAPIAGQGHFIHTYDGDGSPLPSFSGEPVTIPIEDDLGTFTKKIWDSLNSENKVAMFARATDLRIRNHETIIINKHELS